MRKLSAYTIIELVVTMIIFSIVTTIATGIYMSMNKTSNVISKESDSDTELILFHTALKNDIEESDYIIETDYGFIAYLKDNRKVIYEFEDKYVVRDNMILLDTFYVSTNDLIFEKLENDDLVTLISFDLIRDGFEGVSEHFIKKYTNDIKFNQNYKASEH